MISRWTRSIAVFLGALFGPLGVLGLFLGSFVERRLFFWRPKGQWEQYL